MKSTQVSNHDALPYRNSTMDEYGRVRILSFNYTLNNKIIAGEELILAKLPSGMAKILSITLQYNGLEASKLNYYLSQANSFDAIFINSTVALKEVDLLNPADEIQSVINTKQESQFGIYINASLELDLPSNSLFQGYILYVVD